ncbi:ABC transporter ATP-binding protein [Myxococcota bacterium]
MTTLELRNLSIGYPRKRHGPRMVAENLDLKLPQGQFTCLLGPNGAGKSTLLRTLSGLQVPLQGEVLLDGCPLGELPPRRVAQCLSLALTERVAVGALPVWSLVALGRHPYTGWSGRLSQEDESVVQGAIQAMGIGHLAFRPMSELSDGERQKAMIARALAQQPRVMILDEVTAYLDLPHRVELMQLLRELARQRGCSVLLSSHDLDLSLRHADHLWLLSGEGKMREGIPEDLVLGGELGATFADSVLHFDPWSGAFRPLRRRRGRIAVDGESLAAVWTRRALERQGFEVIADRADWRVVLAGNANELPCWRLHGPHHAEGRGLETLLRQLDSVL